MYTEKIIGKNEFIRMTNIASNASPLFIIGTIGVSMLQNKTFGYILLFANYLSCILMSFIIPKGKETSILNIKPSQIKAKNNFGNIF